MAAEAAIHGNSRTWIAARAAMTFLKNQSKQPVGGKESPSGKAPLQLDEAGAVGGRRQVFQADFVGGFGVK